MSDEKPTTVQPRVIIESPYAGDIEANVRYARAALLDSLNRGEYPIASHLLYTQVLDDNNADERRWGIQAGLAWMEVAVCVAVYTDRGISQGMKYAIERASEMGIRIEFRELTDWDFGNAPA